MLEFRSTFVPAAVLVVQVMHGLSHIGGDYLIGATFDELLINDLLLHEGVCLQLRAGNSFISLLRCRPIQTALQTLLDLCK